MTNNTCYTIQLLNKSYDIKCPEKEQHTLKLAADKLSAQMLKEKTKFKNLDDIQALVLAALHVSHELITNQSQQKEQRQQLTKFIRNLEIKISKVAETASL